MYVLNPDQYLLPDYKISPFQTKDIAFNNSLPHDASSDSYFKDRFAGRDFIYTINGRSALNKALAYYNLKPEDVVTILTTSGNFYVSSCVTKEVEKFCSWNREVVTSTKVIIVIHEFGYPFEGWEQILKYNIPVIEDCAYSFFSEDVAGKIDRTGDFAIYSFPKMFPVQIGGLLTLRKGITVGQERWGNAEVENYIKKVLSHYVKKRDEIVESRIANYNWFKAALMSLDFEERSPLPKGVVPGAFMFRFRKGNIDLKAMRDYFFTHGIQCSVFYGEEAFFMPLHQALIENDKNYFTEVIRSFMNET